MGDYLRQCWDRDEKRVREVGLRAGDFVSLLGQYNDVWHEVTYAGDTWVSLAGKRSESLYRVTQIHRAADPWDFQEVGSMTTQEGKFSTWGPKYGDPLPTRFWYHGNFVLEPWLWNYCSRNVTPKMAKDPLPFFRAAGLDRVDEQVPWHRADEVTRRIRDVRIKGWSVYCKKVPTVKFNRTIKI